MTESEKVYTELHRQTERFLEAQQAAAVGRDQRAFVMAGFSVVAAGLAGRTAELLLVMNLNIASILFLLAAAAGASSAFPRAFYGGGYEFSELNPVIGTVSDNQTLLASLAKKNDTYIALNNKSEYRSINLYRLGILLFIAGILVTIAGLVCLRIQVGCPT